jgi:RNA polymerase sigma-70 factor (ECF subfamily)
MIGTFWLSNGNTIKDTAMTPNNIPVDTELLRQMRAGDASAFEALYLRHQGPLFRFALLRSGSADTAADVVQEVFMGLLAGSFAFDPTRGLLQNFLFGVARNLVMKHERPGQRCAALSAPDEDDEDDAVEIASEAAEPLARVLGNELAEHVRRALSLLAPHYRDVVILYEMHDLSYQEIADICRLDTGTVRSRLSRGRAALAKRLAAHRPAINNAA